MRSAIALYIGIRFNMRMSRRFYDHSRYAGRIIDCGAGRKDWYNPLRHGHSDTNLH